MGAGPAVIAQAEEAPLDLASLRDTVDLLARSARACWPDPQALLVRLAWNDAPEPLRALAALDAVGPVRVRVVRECGGLFVEVRAHRPADQPVPCETAAPGSRCGGGWDYYPGDDP